MTRGPEEAGGVPFGDLFAIFQPGIEHLVEEKERQRLDIVQREDGDPPWEIDLDAGTAVLRRPHPSQGPTDAPVDAPVDGPADGPAEGTP